MKRLETRTSTRPPNDSVHRVFIEGETEVN